MARRKTHEKFLIEVQDLVGHSYEVVSEYIGAKTKLTFIHKNESCYNHKFEMTPNAFLNNQRCPECAKEIKRKKKAFSDAEFQKKLHSRLNGEIITNDKYYNSLTTMKFKHVSCGRYFETTSKSLFVNGNCQHCALERRAKLRTKSHSVFVQEIFDLVGEEYKVLGRYKNSGHKIKIMHNNEFCDQSVYKVTPDNFFAGHRCPKCANTSRGEQATSQFLQQHDIKHNLQHRFEDCRNTDTLPFDFAVFDENNNLTFLIEFDGKQHSEPVQFGGISMERAVENFKQTQLHDSIKDKYCIDNNIPLLRIPYWNFDSIETILETELHKYNLLLQDHKALEVV